MQTSIRRTLSLALVLAIVSTVAFVPAAFAGPKSIEGTWRAAGVPDGTSDATETLFTFSRGGTLVASSDSAGTSAGHGTWEKVAGRNFAATNVAFVYDASGVATQVLSTEISIEVSSDGDHFTATFETSVQTLDGTVLATITGTAAGDRIGS